MKEVKDQVNKDLLRLVEQFIQHFEDVDGQVNNEERSHRMITVSNVANASQGELLCMTYEILLHHIQQGIQTKDKAKEEHISQAIEVIKQLVGDLNFEVPIARDLFKLYIYVQNLLINHQYQIKDLEEAYKLIHTIYDGYKEITQKEVNKKPAMQNVESVYAGMTYGKGKLNEIVMTDINRGYHA